MCEGNGMQRDLRISPYSAPCGSCPEKGCGAKHATCEAYIAYRKAADEYNKSKVERIERGMETIGKSARARKYDRAKREGRVNY